MSTSTFIGSLSSGGLERGVWQELANQDEANSFHFSAFVCNPLLLFDWSDGGLAETWLNLEIPQGFRVFWQLAGC